ncbi:hypothetical protein [Virgisporangium aurantiacum]|uniref:Uncharacterized protein n=1 Tax=Virgisporangium aurantiacum TaxID=175570 RepID=A0A8J4E254_9ACTN|nr:hypothetical protein [Virgisporangium aurantiacum]GIJ58644.1 hypothetical protein Vau01_061600 [Virgisporangium aurantiacum]
MLDPAGRERFADLARTSLAAGTTHDDLIADLRRRGLEKIDCIVVLHVATGIPLGEAKPLVHFSPAWSDRRESDERFEEQAWRAGFIWCVLDGGEVTEPPDWAADCRARQQRATGQLREIAAALPPVPEVPDHLQKGRLGDAFAALVAAGRNLPGDHWPALAAAADTLCLTELLGAEPPAEDPTDPVYAAHVVHQRVRPT